jgi:shikimate dehydrogenase
MEKIVLIGEHIGGSRSPAFHNALFREYGLPYCYELMPLGPDEVDDAIRMMKGGGYRGANVTAPHKSRVISSLDRLSATAERLGAVNTILFRDGKALGFNTDVDGVSATLRGDPIVRRPFSAAVLGAGGAAMAAIDALLAEPHLESLTIYARHRAVAQAAAGHMSDARLLAADLASFTPVDVVIHATPVGTDAAPGAVLDQEQLCGVRLLFDMIYVPSETELMRRARRAGARTVNGEAMLVGQAVEAFRVWTGIDVSARFM